MTVLAEQTAAGSTSYIYGLGDSPLGGFDGSSWTYLSGRDPLHSVRQETDAEGRVLTARRFDPYGVPLGGDGGEPFGYTGEYADETGLVFLRARYISAATGRFLTPDTWAGDETWPMSHNLWLYGLGNPVKFVDPSGHEPGIPPINGHLGRTGFMGAGTTSLTLNPATQPLTVSASIGKNEVISPAAPSSRPDDGVLLIYNDPGYAIRREEVILASSETPVLSGLATVGGEVRQVTKYTGILSGEQQASYLEYAASGSVGPGINVGGEWSSESGLAPCLGIGVKGVGAQLQPGQLMLQFGPGRVGAEWQVPDNKLFAVTQQALDGYGGIQGFSRGPGSGLNFVNSYTLKGQKGTSGYDQLLLWMWFNGWQPDPIPGGANQ